MTSSGAPHPRASRAPALIVINPSGNRSRVPLEPLPFQIGRQGDNHLVLRDNRASRSHARIVVEGGEFFIEDLNSRHGVFVNAQKVTRHKLTDSDRVDFGFQIVMARTEVGGYCAHCQVLRMKEMAAAADEAHAVPSQAHRDRSR